MRLRSPLFVLIIGAVAGCGDSRTADLASVSGVVTKGGQPLSDVMVVFMPEKGRPATGKTNAEGRYELGTFNPGDGATVGNHRVSLIPTTNEVPPQPGTQEAANYKAPEPPFDAKYSDPSTSELSATVASGGTTHDIKLP